MKTVDSSGIATRIPAPTATNGRAPASRAIAQVSGAASAPMSANGAADAHATSPKTARNGTWTIDASGIQWAFEGIGRVGIGRDRAADLGEDPDEIDVEAGARVERPGHVDVVRRIGVGRVREMPDQERPDEEGEPV